MSSISAQKIKFLQKKAQQIRIEIIKMLAQAGSGHTAGSLGMADIFSCLYFYLLKHKPKDPNWEKRDRLILSNGHIVPVRYAAMALAGYFPKKELATLRRFGSRLQGHPEKNYLDGLETTSGPLGEGLGQACGIAYAAKLDNKNFNVFCLMSDAEQQAGNTWESVMFAAKNKLNNLIAIIDRNNIQISGRTEKVMPIEPLIKKYQAFNWQVYEIDGHNIRQIITFVKKAKESKKPTVIVARTVAGQGIAEIENDYHWHGKVPDLDQVNNFIVQIKNYAK